MELNRRFLISRHPIVHLPGCLSLASPGIGQPVDVENKCIITILDRRLSISGKTEDFLTLRTKSGKIGIPCKWRKRSTHLYGCSSCPIPGEPGYNKQ